MKLMSILIFIGGNMMRVSAKGRRRSETSGARASL